MDYEEIRLEFAKIAFQAKLKRVGMLSLWSDDCADEVTRVADAMAKAFLNKPEKTRDLKFNMRVAYDEGEPGHPQKVMQKLGIKYRNGVPVPIADQWQFFECENVPDPLPPYLRNINPE